MGLGRKVYCSHSHVGEVPSWPYYGSEEPISPTIRPPCTTEELMEYMDAKGIEKMLVMPNYGIPVHEHPFSLNPLAVRMAREGRGRVGAAIWVSGLPRNQDLTEKALTLLDEPGVLALKMSYLLGGHPDPRTWDEPTLLLHERIFRAAMERDLPIQFHTSVGGNSDISGFFELIKRYGKDLKIHLVHMGGGVSGHIRLIAHWRELIEGGYQVYVDSSWAIGFGPRLLLQELDRTGIGVDRFVFASDEPWSDLEGEFWKIEGNQVSEEIKERVFWGNAEDIYFHKLKYMKN